MNSATIEKPPTAVTKAPSTDPIQNFIEWVAAGVKDKTLGSDCIGCVSRTSIVCLTVLEKTTWARYKQAFPEVKGDIRGIHKILLYRMTETEREESQRGEKRHRFTTEVGWKNHVANRAKGIMSAPNYTKNTACRMYPLRLFGLTLEDMDLFRKVSTKSASDRVFKKYELIDAAPTETHQIGVNMHESQVAELKRRYPTLNPANAVRTMLEIMLPEIPVADYYNEEVADDLISGTGSYGRISNVILPTTHANMLRSLANANEMDLTTMIKILVFTNVYKLDVDLNFV